MPSTNQRPAGGHAVRQFFLDYFARHDHRIVKSSPLIPANDPTLMFVNAGMVQFKELFVGLETRDYKRAVTAQKCLRVSGKHNDLEEVGRTARHHTFFEMLGNFSFGDYFKEQAISLAWDFIIKELGLPADKLWVTVFGGDAEQNLPPDDEARTLWKKIAGLPDDRILGMGMKDNFWSMGDTGPCGPCSEIHYDQGKPSDPTPTLDDFETGRVMEIWNNVFMQFERHADGSLTPLPAPSVDTGMGLERLAAVLQGEDSNYHTDLFLPLLETVASHAGKPYGRSPSDDDVSMRVIADHARATAFLVADGIQPSNEGRGYVLRRVMRRAIRHGHRLGLKDLFFHTICDQVVTGNQTHYPELAEARPLIQKVAELEETNFRRTLGTGLKLLNEAMAAPDVEQNKTLPGAVTFKLYDTHGFPPDLTEVIAAENGVALDQQGFDEAMAAQQARSRGGDVGDKAVDRIFKTLRQTHGPTTFVGYEHEDTPVQERNGGTWQLMHDANGVPTLAVHAKVVALAQNGTEVGAVSAAATTGPDAATPEGKAKAKAEADVVLNPTPFYGESGGQVGDRGLLLALDDNTGTSLKVEVVDTQKAAEDFTVCRVRVLQGTLQQGSEVWAGYNPSVRKQTRAHHSATHLLHGALREVLGDHVKQAGSLVDPDHLRFDYAHFEAPDAETLQVVEANANQRIADNDLVVTEVLPFDEAKEKGAIALFGEKYGDRVRVLTMGRSVEFCGGTHAARTGEAELLLVTKDEAISAGVRRIEAEVADAARRRVTQMAGWLGQAAGMLAQAVAVAKADAAGDTSASKDARDKLEAACAAAEEQQAATGQAVLKAVAKSARVFAQGCQELTTLGQTREGDIAKLKAPQADITLPTGFGLAQAQRVRDLWVALTRMVNGRPADAPAIRDANTASDAEGILATLAALLTLHREHERALQAAADQQQSAQAGDLLSQIETIGDISVLATHVGAVGGKELRSLADQLRNKMGSGVLCLGSESGGKAALLVAVSKDLVGRYHAGKLIGQLAPLVDGRGGGKPELAQAGGSKPEGLKEVFAKMHDLVTT